MSFPDDVTAHAAPDLIERFSPPKVLSLPDPVDSDLGRLTWRPLTRADRIIVHELIQQIEVAAGARTRTPLSQISAILDNSGDRIQSNTLGLFTAEERLVAYGALETPSGDSTVVRVFVHGGVDPEMRQRGVGTTLVNWQVGRARQMLVEKASEVHSRIVTFVEDDLAQRDLFLAHGFSPIRYYKQQRRKLCDPLPVYTPDGSIEIVPWSEELDDLIRIAHNEAFQDHWGSQPRSRKSWVQGHEQFAPEWSFAALDRERTATGKPVIAGYLVSSKYEANWEAAGFSSGYTELLGVVREYRGHRVASGLLIEAMRAYRDAGVEYAELDVDTENPSGAHVFYENLGYETHAVEEMLSIEFPL